MLLPSLVLELEAGMGLNLGLNFLIGLLISPGIVAKASFRFMVRIGIRVCVWGMESLTLEFD